MGPVPGAAENERQMWTGSRRRPCSGQKKRIYRRKKNIEGKKKRSLLNGKRVGRGKGVGWGGI
jgi:hypothetical protein